MAILNFPDNPQSGDQYTGDNGTTYIFDGVKWVGHAISQPAGTNSITNNGYTVQVDADGNLIIPNGSHVLYQDGTALSGAQGPQGVKGDKGDPGIAATIDIGSVTTGIAGSYAAVSNIGTPTTAAFEFTIPRGDKGDRGPAGANGLNGVGDPGPQGDPGPTGAEGVSVTLQGTKATIADLPAAPLNPNDFAGHGWIVTTGDGDAHLNGSLWFWNLTDQVWNDVGPIVGPQGDKGATGDRGATGDTGQNGLDGAGVATGGTEGQVLVKVSSDDFDTHWATNDRLTNTNGDQVFLGETGQLTLPKDTSTSYNSTIGSTWNIRINANGTFYAFASDGYMEIPGEIRAQQGNDLNLKAYNPTVDGVPGGVALTLENIDVDSNSRTTQFVVGAQDVVVTTDFSGAGNEWTFAHDGSLTVPTNGRVNFGQPTLREPSWGSKNELITLYDFNTPGQVNYGIGVSDNAIWMSTDTTTAGFKWFGGEGNLVLDLKGNGELNLVNNIRQGNTRINLNENGVGAVYATPTLDDYTGFYLASDNAALYTQGTVDISSMQPRTQISVVNENDANNNVIWVDKNTYPTVTQVVNGWTLLINGNNYQINSIADETPIAGMYAITLADTTLMIGYRQGVTFASQAVYNDWTFNMDGSLQLPNLAKQYVNPSVVCSAGVDTVIYTGTDTYQHTFKLLIKVEGVETPSEPWETQSTEMIIAKSFSGKIAASAYGVVHTSVDPLATFTARWNPTISRVEVLCRPTSLTYGVEVRTFATEITTSD